MPEMGHERRLRTVSERSGHLSMPTFRWETDFISDEPIAAVSAN
jgi:hypothetical protein